MMNGLDDGAYPREIREAVAMLEPPPLASETFARIAARRARGERVVLRTIDATPFQSRARWGAIAFAAIATTLVAAFVLRRGTGTDSASHADLIALAAVDSACASGPTTSVDSSTLRHLMISAFGVPAACGAEPGQDPPIAFVPAQILPGTFTYSRYSVTDGVFTSRHGSSAIRISRVTWKDSPAILAFRDGPIQTGVHLDSLIVSADGPTPLYWASIYVTQHPQGSIHAVFDSTKISIVMKGHLDTAATIPFRMRSGQLPFGFAWALDVPALPLTEGWRGVIEIAPPIHPRAYRYFMRPWETVSLRVIGRERIRVPAGSFDCWKVQLGDSNSGSFVWVSTVNHLAIRSVSMARFGDTSFEDHSELESAVFIQN